ncbi:MAG: hypothetical protein KAI17_25085, partial [Thiotrichaceae bacterium]|nr:hypothetical protein [Thiotrichaceae bacterium]
VGKAQAGIRLNANRVAVLEQQYPVQVTDYLKNYKSGGNILNVLEFGGYLLNKLAPDYKIYFDGRSNILYPIGFVKHNGEIWRDKKMLAEVVERYDIDYVVFANTPERFVMLERTKNLKLSFADDNFMLFSIASKAEFPIVSTLLAFPRCWNNKSYQDAFSTGVYDEIEKSENLFSDKQYTVKIALELMNKYLKADSKKEFFDTLQFEARHTDAVRRIALYMAMEDTDIDTATRLFSTIKVKHHYDLLLYSYYLAQNGKYEDAENLAYYFYLLDEDGDVTATHDKFGVLGRIFRILKEHDQLQKFETAYVDELAANLKKVNYPFDRELSFDFMCK